MTARRLLASIAVLLALASPAVAGRLQLQGGAPQVGLSSNLLATQVVPFGAKTRVGHGGSPMGYLAPGLLTNSRWLGITSITDGASTVQCASQAACLANNVDWTIDDRQMLVPANNHAGTYGGLWSPVGAGGCTIGSGVWAGTYALCYTIVVQEYLDAAKTVLSPGSTSTITVPVLPNAAFVREQTICGIFAASPPPCEPATPVSGYTMTANPDGGVLALTATTTALNSFVNTKWQIETLTNLAQGVAGALMLGDTVYARTGTFNPNALEYRWQPPAPGTCSSGPSPAVWCTGTGGYASNLRVQFVSEIADTNDGSLTGTPNLDSYGNLRNKSGFQLDGINGVVTGTTPYSIPADFRWVWFYHNQAPSYLNNKQDGIFGFVKSTVAYNLGFDHVRVETGPACAVTGDCDNMKGLITNPQASVTYSHFISSGTSGVLVMISSVSGLTARWNVAELLPHDFIDFDTANNATVGNNDIEYNFAFNFQHQWNQHSDFAQKFQDADCGGVVNGIGTGLCPNPMGTFAYNVFNRSYGSVYTYNGVTVQQKDAQFIHFRSASDSDYIGGAVIKNNVAAHTFSDCEAMGKFDAPVVQNNTCLTATASEPTFNGTSANSPGQIAQNPPPAVPNFVPVNNAPSNNSVFYGYIDNGTPGQAGFMLHVTSVVAGVPNSHGTCANAPQMPGLAKPGCTPSDGEESTLGLNAAPAAGILPNTAIVQTGATTGTVLQTFTHTKVDAAHGNAPTAYYSIASGPTSTWTLDTSLLVGSAGAPVLMWQGGQYQTAHMDGQSGTYNPANPAVDERSRDGVWNYNFSNIITFDIVTGAPTITPNGQAVYEPTNDPTDAASVAHYRTALPNWPLDATRCTNRAACIAISTPGIGATFTATPTGIGSAILTVTAGSVPPDGSFVNAMATGNGGFSRGAYVASHVGSVLTMNTVADSAPGSTVYSTGMMNSDHTYNGALTPLDSGGVTCWNTPGLVFDNTKTCVQNGTTPAQ